MIQDRSHEQRGGGRHEVRKPREAGGLERVRPVRRRKDPKPTRRPDLTERTAAKAKGGPDRETAIRRASGSSLGGPECHESRG